MRFAKSSARCVTDRSRKRYPSRAPADFAKSYCNSIWLLVLSCPRKRPKVSDATSAGDKLVCCGQVLALNGGGHVVAENKLIGLIAELPNSSARSSSVTPGLRKFAT